MKVKELIERWDEYERIVGPRVPEYEDPKVVVV